MIIINIHMKKYELSTLDLRLEGNLVEDAEAEFILKCIFVSRLTVDPISFGRHTQTSVLCKSHDILFLNQI